MKKVMLLSAFLVGTMMSHFAFSQASVRLGVALPHGDLGKNLSIGTGLEASWLKRDIFEIEGLSVGGSVGYYSFTFSDESFFSGIDMSIIPIMGIAEYRFSEGNMTPYAVAGLGYYLRSLSTGIAAFGVDSPIGAKIGGGIRYGFGDNFGLNGELSYHLAGDSPFLNVGAGIYFKFW